MTAVISPAALNLQSIIESEDEHFEDAVCSMDVPSLLDLVSTLQNAMAVEQRYFDALSQKLESVPPSSTEYQKLSTALCASQLQLAKLCTRNMRCFTQQAIRAREDPASLVASNTGQSICPGIPTYLKASSSPVFDYDDNLMHDFNTVERLTQDQVHNLIAASGFDNVDAQLRHMLEEGSRKNSNGGVLNDGDDIALDIALSSHDDDTDDVDQYDYYVNDPMKELEVIPEEDREEQYYEEPQRRKIQPLKLQSHLIGSLRTPSPRFDASRLLDMDASSESSDSNSVNTVVTEIRNQFSRQIKNNQNGTNGTGNAEAHKLLEERAEKVRAAMEKLIRDHQPKISHSANLLTLIKNFETIAKNNEKVFERIRHHQAPPRRKIVSATSYINQSSESESDERSTVVNFLNPVTVSMSNANRPTAATFARESIFEDSESLKPVTIHRLKLPNPGNDERDVPTTNLTDQLGNMNFPLKSRTENANSTNDTHEKSTFLERNSREREEQTVVGAQALVENMDDPLDSLANSKWSKSLSSTNLCGSEALVSLLKTMYVLPEVEPLEAPPSFGGYANIVLHSKFREKYLRLEDGKLKVYEGEFTERPLQKIDLTGKCFLQILDDRSIGLEFSSPTSSIQATVIQLPATRDRDIWFQYLVKHADISLNFVVPAARPLSSHKKCVVIDLGSCSIRAGILMDQPTLPQIYFPSFCAIDKTSKKVYFNEDALNENIRKNCRTVFPLAPADKVVKLTMDISCLSHIVYKIFSDLRLTRTQLKDYNVQVILPQTYSLSTQSAIAKLFLEEIGVRGINITHQAICALYAYNTTSGIIVDIGNRLDILPIADGYVVDSGVSRLLNGDQKIVQNLAHELAQKRVSLFNQLDVYMLRHIFQQLCYVAPDYTAELHKFNADPKRFSKTLRLSGVGLQCGPDAVIELDQARFSVPEGLFQPQLWGLDCTGLSKLIAKAVMQTSIDMRKQMARSIYLSGGLTLVPGLRERIIKDVSKNVHPALKIQVHASPYRDHMSYIGACTMASTGAFDRQCVKLSQWSQKPEDCFKFWHVG